MPRIIYAPSNGPACSMEDLVAQYIDWSPTIYNDVSQGFYMAPEQMQYCPTKSQIKNSASMSVTLYKQAVYKDSSIIQFKKGTTYKFNGEVGQFPKLYVLDMYPDFKPTKQYSSNELVKLCDVSAFYNHHKITLRLNNFSLIDGKFPTVSSNLVIENDNVHIVTDHALYLYDMKEETYFSWSLPKINSVANSEQYKEDKFTYNVIGYDNLAGSYTLGETIDVTDVEHDVTIDVYAEKHDLVNIYISTDGRVRVINYLREFDLSSEKAVEENTIIDPPITYATYKTDYHIGKYYGFKFLIQPDDSGSLESYEFELKKNGVGLYSGGPVSFTDKPYIYAYTLLYRDTETSVPNSYTLMITTKEKYRGINIRIIINNEVADSLDIEVSEESNSSGFEEISSKTTSTKMEFSYVIQKQSTRFLYIKVTGNSLLRDYDLINYIYASNNTGNHSDVYEFGNGIYSAVLAWDLEMGSNKIIYIKIDRTQLIDVTIKRLTAFISVHDNYSGNDVVFNGNSAIISTIKAHSTAVDLTVKNRSTSYNLINYKWYVRSNVDADGYWKIGYNETVNFKQEDLLPGKNYTLELKGSTVTYSITVISVANVNVYEYDYSTGMFKDGSICTAGNGYTATVNTTNIKPNEVKLKFVSAAPDVTTLIYDVYDTLPSREFIVTNAAMDITGSGTVWTSPPGMFETYENDIIFQAHI